ncbi:MAG: winged helix-turn-helix domain-containing protein [Candidatus Thermoplasmatota archaeon]|nr:winged helix-turn-helix domain-containing protein [Candidatus Thermoplasmatota archaeon]
MKQLLWWLIAGTKGGINRAHIIKALKDRPYNANQLSELLKLDYKTVRHHLKVLLDNNIIVTSGESEKYGAMYFLSKATEENYKIFEEIWEKIGKK